MKVILTEDVKKFGKKGDIVNMKQGYFRNFIKPKNLGVEATKENLEVLNKQLAELKKQEDANIKKANETKEKIESTKLNLKVKVGEEGKLFGSITNKDIMEALAKKGIDVDKKKIDKVDKIDSLGEYEVSIKLFQQIDANLKVIVEAE